jgi:hypothetical protein
VNRLNPPSVSKSCHKPISDLSDHGGRDGTWTGMARYRQFGSAFTSSRVLTLDTLYDVSEARANQAGTY